MSGLASYLALAIVLDHAHLVSPIALAWSDRGYRQKMYREWERYILLPVVLIIAATTIGALAVSSQHGSPQAIFYPAFWQAVWQHGYIPNGWYWGLITTYFIWNAWHFGSQHFGIASLLGWRRGSRRLRQAVTIIPTVFLMLGFIPCAILGEAVSFLHWTSDIGLSTWRAQRWVWFLAVAALGFVGFFFKAVQGERVVVYAIPILVSLRCGLGFVHFLYSRWVWRRTEYAIDFTMFSRAKKVVNVYRG